MQYSGSNNLAALFNISNYYVSVILDETIPYLVEYFSKFIPNHQITETRSRLHPRLKYIIDGTLHQTKRLSDARYGLDELYNGHYKLHGRVTQILLDYEGNVISFQTNIKGKIHDTHAAKYNKHFQKIVGKDFALGDPGFGNVDYVIAGFKPTTLNSWDEHVFDRISRQEQVLIENVNNFIKKSKALNCHLKFIHGEHRLLGYFEILLIFNIYVNRNTVILIEIPLSAFIVIQ